MCFRNNGRLDITPQEGHWQVPCLWLSDRRVAAIGCLLQGLAFALQIAGYLGSTWLHVIHSPSDLPLEKYEGLWVTCYGGVCYSKQEPNGSAATATVWMATIAILFGGTATFFTVAYGHRLCKTSKVNWGFLYSGAIFAAGAVLTSIMATSAHGFHRSHTAQRESDATVQYGWAFVLFVLQIPLMVASTVLFALGQRSYHMAYSCDVDIATPTATPTSPETESLA